MPRRAMAAEARFADHWLDNGQLDQRGAGSGREAELDLPSIKRMQLTVWLVTALAGSTIEALVLRDDLTLFLTFGQGRAGPPAADAQC